MLINVVPNLVNNKNYSFKGASLVAYTRRFWNLVNLFCPTPHNPWNSPGQNTGVGSLSLHPGDLPNPGIEPRSPSLQADSLQSEPPGKL